MKFTLTPLDRAKIAVKRVQFISTHGAGKPAKRPFTIKDMKENIRVLLALLTLIGIAVAEDLPSNRFENIYRLAQSEFIAGSPVSILLESKRFFPKSRYDVLKNPPFKEVINLSYIPDTVRQYKVSENGRLSLAGPWVKGPSFSLGKLAPGNYVVRIHEFPKCHRDPSPCTGGMWIGPVIQTQISVK